MSQGFLATTDNNYLVTDSTKGSFEFFEAGLTVSKQLSDRLRVGMQLFGHRFGALGNDEANVDWAYLDYHLRDWIGFRAGRIKLPFGLYNDTTDIDAAHPTALLPQAMYPASNRDYLLAQTGAEIYGYREFRKLGALDYRLYFGSIYLDLPPQAPNTPFYALSVKIPYVGGGRLMWETPIEGLRVGASLQYLRLDYQILDQLMPGAPSINARIPARLAIASIEYVVDNASFAAEFARWKVRIDSDNELVVPDTHAIQTRAYAQMAYHVTPRFQPALTYGFYYPGTGKNLGPSAKQHDASVTLRFDLTPNWILKLEGHALRGTADVSQQLNPTAKTLDDLADRWWMFIAKTTVYF